MNDREKLLSAINEFNASQQAQRDVEKQVGVARTVAKEKEQHLCKTLHAVLGTRCEDGAVLAGKKYAAKILSPGHYELVVSYFTCEVLG